MRRTQPSILAASPPRATGSVGGVDRWFARTILAAAGQPAIAIVLWNGEEIAPPGAQPVVQLLFRSRRALYGLAVNPELNFGDLYSTGQIDIEGDFLAGLETVYRAMSAPTLPWYGRALRRISQYRPRANTLDQSRSNIRHHYDLDSDFYSLWLDQALQYTCAYYPAPQLTLEQAQIAKMHHIARKLCLQPGQRVVEAGSGWGGLALFLARRYGVHVRSYNISHEQVRYARERLKQTDLGDRVEYVEDDYRNISGTYDVFVSVGMLEHVGPANYDGLGRVIERCLSDRGMGLIHSIGRNRAQPMNAWIERRIFPGAYPPALREMMDIFEPQRFSVLDVENLRLHYARTLTAWLERFEANADVIEETCDEVFVRAWRLYLLGSVAAFNVGALQLFQVVFTRADNNDVPWSRAHFYREHP
ncbi:MAG: class I SAM-dependent methyltransferase [Chromatiales bacterium]